MCTTQTAWHFLLHSCAGFIDSWAAALHRNTCNDRGHIRSHTQMLHRRIVHAGWVSCSDTHQQHKQTVNNAEHHPECVCVCVCEREREREKRERERERERERLREALIRILNWWCEERTRMRSRLFELHAKIAYGPWYGTDNTSGSESCTSLDPADKTNQKETRSGGEVVRTLKVNDSQQGTTRKRKKKKTSSYKETKIFLWQEHSRGKKGWLQAQYLQLHHRWSMQDICQLPERDEKSNRTEEIKKKKLSNATKTKEKKKKQQQQQNIKLILKTIGNRKGDCAWSCSRWQTQPEIICKSQRTNQCHSLRTLYWFVLCNLQIISGCVCHLEQLHAQSPFLFPIVFSINLIPFFDICSVLDVLSPGLFGFVPFYLGRCADATVAVCGFGRWFGVSLRAATSNLPSSPDHPSEIKQTCAPAYKTVDFSQSNALRE